MMRSSPTWNPANTNTLTRISSRTYLKIGCAARLLCRFLARPSLYVHVLSRDSLRAFAYSGCSPHFEISSRSRRSLMDARIFEEPKIDCHMHVFDPARFPYHANTHYAPTGQEMGTPAQLEQMMDAYGMRYALLVGPNSGYGLDNS